MFAKEHFALQTEICTFLKNNNAVERVKDEQGKRTRPNLDKMIIDLYK